MNRDRRSVDLVIVSQVFYPDQQATGQLLAELVSGIQQKHYRCEVLTAYPANPVPGHVLSRETWNGVAILRGGLAIAYRRNLFLRITGYATFTLWLLKRLAFNVSKGSKVLVITNPPFAPIIAWLCSYIGGWKYYIAWQDVFPDGLVAIGKIRRGGIIDRFWRYLGRKSLLRAERVIPIGRDMNHLAANVYDVAPEKMRYIPNWGPFEMGYLKEPASSPLWTKLEYGEKFVVQYSGNMGIWHDIDTIVRAAEILKENKNVAFLMVGGGARRDDAFRLSKMLCLESMTWLPAQDKHALESTLACCSVAIISLRAGLEGVAVPSKIYGILASGRSIIAQVPAKSEIAQVIEEEGCGLVVPPGDANRLADAIALLESKRDLLREQAARGRRAYEQKYTSKSAVDAYCQCLFGLTERGDRSL